MTTYPTKTCKECDGSGYIEYDVPIPHGVNNDIGFIDTGVEVCFDCQGLGFVSEEN